MGVSILLLFLSIDSRPSSGDLHELSLWCIVSWVKGRYPMQASWQMPMISPSPKPSNMRSTCAGGAPSAAANAMSSTNASCTQDSHNEQQDPTHKYGIRNSSQQLNQLVIKPVHLPCNQW